MTEYNHNNIFAKIIRGDLSCNKVTETEHTLAFHDAYPQAPIHVLIVPKKPYTCFTDFMYNADTVEIIDLFTTTNIITAQLQCDKSGFRLTTNQGQDGGQEVPHFHIHLMAGKKLGSKI